MPGGVILAGGRSTRFGDQDKTLVNLAGTPLIRRVADRVTHVTDHLVINCRDDQVDAIAAALESLETDVRFAPDPTPDQGPLAGIRTGLKAVDSPVATVVACDMPFVAPSLLEYLFDLAPGYDAVIPRLADGWLQTTQAVYRTTPMVTAADQALTRSDARIVAALDNLTVRHVEETELEKYADLQTFTNINTQEELTAATANVSQE